MCKNSFPRMRTIAEAVSEIRAQDRLPVGRGIIQPGAVG